MGLVSRFKINELCCLKPEDLILDHPVPHFNIIDSEVRGSKMNQADEKYLYILSKKIFRPFPWSKNPALVTTLVDI